MIKLEKRVEETMDRIAKGMLKSIFQQLFYQDYTECLQQLGEIKIDGKTVTFHRGEDQGTRDCYDYPWEITYLDENKEGWQAQFNVVDNFSVQFSHDCNIDEFEFIETKEHPLNQLMSEMIAVVVAVTTKYHPNGAKLSE